ncbi:uncharacterized protein N7483_004380 [Penicillium malachiteum]|uniref:uncharacterized protein n=1 Tax=Penicillium malachiteum TaxID=1324776 RepID=UPI0025483F55|nr:uncharacterized protein N7483_004380 [Penicillium malachiteum]KAJ5729872.1 hypothetical protein N7483_004380 [Penicillium malachiteum]
MSHQGGRGRGGGSFRGDLPIRGSSHPRGDYRGGRGGSRGGGFSAKAETSEVLTKDPPAENAELRKFEDNCIKKNLNYTGEAGVIRRPNYATTGRSTLLRANFFELGFKDPQKAFHCYTVKMDPEPKLPRLKREVFQEILLTRAVKALHGTSDMVNELVTLGPLEDWERGMTIKIHGPSPGKTPKGAWQPFAAIPFEGEMVATRILNIVLTRCPQNDTGIVTTGKGRQKFFWIDDRKQYADLGGGLEVLRGFFSSVRLGADRLLLNLNVNHGTFIRGGEMTKLTDEYVNTHGEDREGYNRFVKGLAVELMHLPEYDPLTPKHQRLRQKKYIWGVATPSDGEGPNKPNVARVASHPKNVEFWEADKDDKTGKTGKYTTVHEYFQRKYPKFASNLGRRPVLNLGTKQKPRYVPQEVCRVPIGQIFNGELCTSQRQAMIKFSCRRPPDNFVSIIRDGLKVMGIENQLVREVNLDISKQMIGVPARMLNPPTLRYGGNKSVRPTNGSWNLRDFKFTQPPQYNPWGVFVFANGNKWPHVADHWKAGSQPERSINEFIGTLAGLGISWRQPEVIRVLVYTSSNYRSVIANAFQSTIDPETKKPKYLFMLTLMFDNEEKVFNHVKWQGDVRFGILTHCAKIEKFIGGDKQYMANNAMKVNLKLGGVCQSFDTNACKLLQKAKTMIVGLDVTHPTGADPKFFPSIAAIVASTDGRLGQWPGDTRAQKERKEMITDLGSMLEGCIMRWKNLNKVFPENIIIYRDGVSEGQYKTVMDDEVAQIKTMFRRVYQARKGPNVTFIIVTKRHHVRFFPTKSNDLDRNANPQPGMVVDRGVTRAVLWDFYLQAQSAIMGSARPAHYVVMYDEIFTNKAANPEGKPADALQDLTHGVCYMMGRCTRSVSYSTPAFLADRFCDRARRWAKACFNEAIEMGQERDQIPFPEPRKVTQNGGITNYMCYI